MPQAAEIAAQRCSAARAALVSRTRSSSGTVVLLAKKVASSVTGSATVASLTGQPGAGSALANWRPRWQGPVPSTVNRAAAVPSLLAMALLALAAPVVAVTGTSYADAVMVPGQLGRGVTLGVRPPMVTDFLDERVSATAIRRPLRKITGISASEFAVARLCQGSQAS